VPTLIRSLYEARWNGTLTVTNAGVAKSITVHEGRMVFAASSSPDDRLGELLLTRGRLSLKVFLDASKQIQPGRRLGTILVEMGALTPKDLVRAVIEQTQEIIYSMFLWTEGHYRLGEGPPSPESIKLNLSTPDLIMEGIKRITAWTRIDHAIGGAAAVYRRGSAADAALSHMTLEPDVRKIADELEQPRSVAEICAASALVDVDVCRALWAFRVIGVAVDARAASPSPTPFAIDDDGLGAILGSGESGE
jgi:uncharacterized protein DUF4388